MPVHAERSDPVGRVEKQLRRPCGAERRHTGVAAKFGQQPIERVLYQRDKRGPSRSRPALVRLHADARLLVAELREHHRGDAPARGLRLCLRPLQQRLHHLEASLSQRAVLRPRAVVPQPSADHVVLKYVGHVAVDDGVQWQVGGQAVQGAGRSQQRHQRHVPVGPVGKPLVVRVEVVARPPLAAKPH